MIVIMIVKVRMSRRMVGRMVGRMHVGKDRAMESTAIPMTAICVCIWI